MATINGARALGIDELTGSLHPGKRADLIFVDLNRPQLTPLHNPVANLAYSLYGSEVERVFVNGRELVSDGSLLTLDEEQILSLAAERALGLTSSE